jgi:hypothetical protein
LRHLYSVPTFPANRRCALALAASLLLPACSLSVPLFSDEAPATTGSIATPVQVQEPLPQSLAYSDATRIGQAAVEALSEVDRGGGGEWVNARTGSSGTLDSRPAQSSNTCSLFNTTVTSIGGVHRYSGEVCKVGHGRPVVKIADPVASPQA